MNNFWKVLTLVFLGGIFFAVLTHAQGFSQASGTLFTGVSNITSTLATGGAKTTHG